MTQIDRETVERLAEAIRRHQTRKRALHKANPRYAAPDDRYAAIPDTLLALLAALDAETARADRAEAEARGMERAAATRLGNIRAEIVRLSADGKVDSETTERLLAAVRAQEGE